MNIVLLAATKLQRLTLCTRITLAINLLFAALAFANVTSPCTFGIPTIVMLNNMSCYLFRSIRLGFYRDNTIHTSAINRAMGTEDCDHGQQNLGRTATQSSTSIPE